MKTDNPLSGVAISKCRKYRYKLWYIWDDSKPKVMFIMLNPSYAESEKNNPTVKRCIAYAKDWGFGGIYVGNIYAYRTPNPKELKEAGYPKGEQNKKALQEMAQQSELTICAWGVSANKQDLGKPKWLFSILDNLHYLALSKNGTPKHPLYLKKDLKPILWDR